MEGPEVGFLGYNNATLEMSELVWYNSEDNLKRSITVKGTLFVTVIPMFEQTTPSVGCVLACPNKD